MIDLGNDVLILGGVDAGYHEERETQINKLIKLGGVDIDEDTCHHYQALLSQIKVNEIRLNSEFEGEHTEIDTMVNIVVNNTNEKERRVFVTQYANMTHASNIFLGLLIINLTNGERLLVLDRSLFNNHSSNVEVFITS